MAFFIYHADRLYDLRGVYDQSVRDMNHLTDTLRTGNEANASIDALWVFVLAVLILSFVLALKRVLAKRSLNADNEEDESRLKDYIQDNYGLNGDKSIHACE